MLPLLRQRILSTISYSIQQRGVVVSTVPTSSAFDNAARLFHSSNSVATAAPATAAAAEREGGEKQQQQQQQGGEEEEAPVPIVWTTHRLSNEQIKKVDSIFHKVLWLDLFETSMLTELINQRLGLTMSPKQRKALERQMNARALANRGGGGAADKKEEVAEEEGPKLVDLKLAGFDDKAKIKVIKEIRAIAGLGLKEAKELVESAPKVIQKGLTLEAAEEMKKKLEEIGATIELV